MCKYKYGGSYEAFIFNKFFSYFFYIIFVNKRQKNNLSLYTLHNLFEKFYLSKKIYIFEVRVGRLVDI